MHGAQAALILVRFGQGGDRPRRPAAASVSAQPAGIAVSASLAQYELPIGMISSLKS